MMAYDIELAPSRPRTKIDYGAYEGITKEKVRKTEEQIKAVPKKVHSKVKSKAVVSKGLKLYVAAIFIIFAIIIVRSAIINEVYTRKESVKAQVMALQKENAQLKIQIENSLNLDNIEREAIEKLGMLKSNYAQKDYINVEKADYIEAQKNEIIEENKLWVVNVVDSLLSSIK